MYKKGCTQAAFAIFRFENYSFVSTTRPHFNMDAP
ncbi:MAG: hypothetical protein FNNCIFGK_00470 [Bacteroidia bacterium]|nr:MAG: hypothetical protein UZ10_BCD003000296 [Bacteroidetes bacterium OLB10]MBV6453239.1 hypothetical protein [Bacteroidia bacterium]